MRKGRWYQEVIPVAENAALTDIRAIFSWVREQGQASGLRLTFAIRRQKTRLAHKEQVHFLFSLHNCRHFSKGALFQRASRHRTLRSGRSVAKRSQLRGT